METVLDIKKILATLPHRYPFVLVDRILEIEPGVRVVGLKNVTINEPFFMGHFPQEPVMPGVLIMEALAQAGGILAFEGAPDKKPGSLIYFTAMDKVRFRRRVVPGDQLILTLDMVQQRSRAIKMKGTATVDGALAAEAELMAVWGDNA